MTIAALVTVPAVDVMPVEAIPRIVHGEQDFHFHRPIRPGDKLVSRGKMIGYQGLEKGTRAAIVLECRTEDGELVNEQYVTTFVRGFNVGKAVGELECRGPWITASYYLDNAPEKFHDGWLRTGDVGTLDAEGFVRLTDRAKDVIKSGGEWISSMELENILMAHPDVAEAAVIGVADEKWGERPLAAVVLRSGADVTADKLRAFMAEQIPRWQLPERWCFVDEVPKTSVGKFSKRTMRDAYQNGNYEVIEVR